MASQCGGTGFVATTRCPQCGGTPASYWECAEARRRSVGQEISRCWESASFFTGPSKVVVRHGLGRVPADVRVFWERTPRVKAAMAGQAEPAADVQVSIGARTADTVEVTLTVTPTAEPGQFRLMLFG